MRRPEKPDLVLLGGLAIGLVVMFQQPLQRMLEGGSSLQERYGLSLVPGLAVLCIVFLAHHLISRLDRNTKTEHRNDAEQLVRVSRTLSQATSMDELRGLLNRHLPHATDSGEAWAVVRVDGEWEALAGGLPKTPYRVAPEIEARADQFVRLAADKVDSVRGNQIDGHVCFGLPFGDHGAGVMGVPLAAHNIDAASRILAPMSAVLGICARNVALIKEIEAHGVLDGLTKCLNRTHGMTVLDAELQRAKRTRTQFTIILLDLDYFKSVNDEHGHLCGDALLTAVGKRMHELLRNSDVKVRWGGEEFLIMLPDTPPKGAEHVANVLNRELGKVTVTWNDEVVSRTVSAGVAAARPGELDTMALLSRADSALYRAKHEGRNRICLEFDQEEAEPATVGEASVVE